MFSVIYSCLLPTWVISFHSLPATATNEILQKSRSSSLLSDHDLVWTGLPNHMLTEKYLDTGHYQTIDRGIPQVKYQQKHVANPPSHHHSQKKLETSKPSHSKMDNEQPTWIRFTNSPLMGPSQIWVLRLLHQQQTTSSSNVSKYLGDSAAFVSPAALFFSYF